MKDLLELRDEIDLIDRQIVELYEKRMGISEEVANYKIANGKKVFDKQREVEKLKSLSAMTDSKFLSHGITELFEQIMAMSRKKQYQLLSKAGIVEPTTLEKDPNLFRQTKKVVYQGVEGSNGMLAMQEFFDGEYESFHVETWRDAMNAIKNQEADFAVLPIENSSAGIVSENFDLLAEYDCYIVAEQIIKIEHSLLALEGSTLSDITDVYSHPQALAQCSKFFEEHREIKKHSMLNTAMSAKKVNEDQDKTQAAIASAINAEIYGLDILEAGIQDNKTNSTRFVIVSAKPVYSPEAGKIALCFELPHTCGSLYHILSHFIYNNVNMTNIQSRPIQGKNWEYRFFVDIEGTLEDNSVKNALYGLEEETSYLKILGTY